MIKTVCIMGEIAFPGPNAAKCAIIEPHMRADASVRNHVMLSRGTAAQGDSGLRIGNRP
jgi:hypothetical protein